MTEPEISFRFIEFNSRRHARGAEAARMYVLEDGVVIDWLWMSQKDIRKNIKEFGTSDELRKALAAYG